jgi:hypothetical protein
VNYDVVAKPWKHGWELHIEGVGVTQSRTLVTAAQVVRDYVAALYGLHEDTSSINVRVTVDDAVAVSNDARGKTNASDEADDRE